MSSTTFLDLQNGFYNAFTQGLGISPGTPLQLLQPSPPLVSATKDGEDPLVWAYLQQPARLLADRAVRR